MPLTAPYPHDPDALLDYPVDWSGWLTGDDTISDSAWTVQSGDVTIDQAKTGFTDTVTTVWITGGTAGQTAELVNHITCASGREDDRTLRVKIKEL